MRLFLSAVFIVVVSSAAPLAPAADLSSGKDHPIKGSPCVFTAQELASVFGNFFEAGVVKQEEPGIESCSYLITGGGESVVVTIDNTTTAERFARLTKSRMKMRGEAHNIGGVGDAAFSTANVYSARKGNKSIEIKGFRAAAARTVQFEEGIELLKLGVDRI